MPIHLPPIPRRRFIRQLLASSAGVALSPRVFAAAAKDADPHSWALLADPHIAADPAQISRGVNMADHFKTVTRDLIALNQRPAGVFIAGDCALSSGETGDYATLGKLLEPIREEQLPVHLALGNHDNRERFWEAFANEKTPGNPLAQHHVAIVRSERVNWFMLDSLEKTLSTPGLVGPEQLDWLAKALDANADRPALILVHHNPGITERITGIKDTEALLNVLRPRKHVKALIFGHTHYWLVSEDESGIHHINLPPVAYVFREGNPSGWVHASVEREGMTLQLHSVDRAHPVHGKKAELKWRA